MPMEQKKEIEKCEFLCVHEDTVREVLKKMPSEETLYDLAEFFKVFGDSTRIRILYALHENELCVCDIAVILNMTKSAVSHQLKYLRQMDIVKNRRSGKEVFYTLADDHVKQIFAISQKHMGECHK